jgi:protein-S-isoprenylcysteine O-methyltransferase Ste14
MAATGDETTTRRGLLASARQVVAELTALARLERELARNELRKKSAALGAGAGVAVVAVLLLPFVIGFGLAAAAAALALVLATWLALLIVFALLLALLLVLAVVAVALFRRASPLKPEQAAEEARLTAQALRRLRGG